VSLCADAGLCIEASIHNQDGTETPCLGMLGWLTERKKGGQWTFAVDRQLHVNPAVPGPGRRTIEMRYELDSLSGGQHQSHTASPIPTTETCLVPPVIQNAPSARIGQGLLDVSACLAPDNGGLACKGLTQKTMWCADLQLMFELKSSSPVPLLCRAS
jgi:hypothetical protein